MQCPGCGFQNMPGSDGCVRCGSPLNLATIALDVHPPRRGGLPGALRRIRALQWTWAGLSHRLVRTCASFVQSRADRFDRRATALGLLWRLPVPGWAHLYAAQFWEGGFFLASFMGLLFGGLLYWGTTAGAVLLGAVFVIHQTAVLDVLHQFRPERDLGLRVLRSLKGMACLALGVYLPIFLLLMTVAEPMTFQFPAGPFHTGDVVLINHWCGVRPGQIVLYDVPVTGVVRQRAMSEWIDYRIGGPTIDRVLAVGGDHIRWADGALYVNGVQSFSLPLNPAVLSTPFSLDVPAGTALIFPTAMQWTNEARSDPSVWSAISCVPRTRITGTIYFRWQPSSRRGLIQ
jgi:hypothetical protein